MLDPSLCMLKKIEYPPPPLGAAQACLSLNLSKCQIIGIHMSRLIFVLTTTKSRVKIQPINYR